MPHIAPLQMPGLSSNWPRWTHAKKAILPLLQESCAAGPMGGGNGKRWREKTGVTKERGHFRGPRTENQDNPASVLMSQGQRSRLPTPPEPCHFSASTPTSLTPRHHPEMAPMAFSSYCQYAIFFMVKKKVIISRNNMHTLSVNRRTFFRCLFFRRVSLEFIASGCMFEGGVSRVE